LANDNLNETGLRGAPMADEIEEREVHLVRVGAGELLAALKGEDMGRGQHPVQSADVHLEGLDGAEKRGQGASGEAGPALVG
jgi:hypothetical protein